MQAESCISLNVVIQLWRVSRKICATIESKSDMCHVVSQVKSYVARDMNNIAWGWIFDLDLMLLWLGCSSSFSNAFPTFVFFKKKIISHPIFYSQEKGGRNKKGWENKFLKRKKEAKEESTETNISPHDKS
jgi:hypothetical protein